jgi:hypothetical protein
MADGVLTNPSIDRAEHDHVESAKRVLPVLWNGTGTAKAPTPFLTKPFDTVVINYTDSTKATISTIVSKLAGVTQETITLTETSTSDTYTRT